MCSVQVKPCFGQIKGRFQKEKETQGKCPIPLKKGERIDQSRFFKKISIGLSV